MNRLVEDSRSTLLSKSKQADQYADKSKGKNRFERRTKSKVASSVRQYNSIDMNKFFKDDILEVNVEVTGETDTYEVKIRFSGVLEETRKQVERNNGQLNLRCVSISLINCFNKDDIYVFCSCADFHYRFGYFLSKNNITSGPIETRPSNITNPNDSKGRGCKHILLVLNNNSWLMKVASVIINYTKYMEKHQQKLYADIIYPAIYGKPYNADVQLGMFDDTDLVSDRDTIDTSNKEARARGQFKKGNQSGVQFAPKQSTKQVDLDNLFDEEE